MEIEKILTSTIVDTSSLIGYFSTDKESLIQLITVYLSDTEPRVEILKNSEEALDYEAVRSIAHFLKSSIGLMGVGCLDEIVALEEKTQHRDAEEEVKKDLVFVNKVLQESVLEYKRILEELEAL